MKKSALGLSLLLGLGVLMTACGDDGGASATGGTNGCPTGEVACSDEPDGCLPEADATLAWVQANVFDKHACANAGCHNGANPDMREDLDLTSEQSSFDTLVGVESQQTAPQLLVEPSNSGASHLVDKLLGENLPLGTLLMPLGATEPLCAAKIDGVEAWIDAGATAN